MLDGGTVTTILDPFLAPGIRGELERRYWRHIEEAAGLDRFTADPSFLDDPARHPALFSDHGVVHVRDVALGCLQLLERTAGLLLPDRSAERWRTVAGAAVAMAYLHDIGMVESSAERRRLHPQWAAHEVYQPGFAPLVDALFDTAHPIVERIGRIGPFEVPDRTVVREVLALALAHSKTLVPSALLADPPSLRAFVADVLLTDLDSQLPGGPRPSPGGSPVRAHYPDPGTCLAWLTSARPEHRSFAADVLDAVRVLRAADALRQRGTVLRTSAGFEILLDTESAHAVYAVRSAPGAPTLHLLVDNPISAGEAALERTEVTASGHLPVSLHRATFADAAIRDIVADRVAAVVLDVEADVLPTFAEATGDRGTTARRMDGLAMRVEVASRSHDRSLADAVAERFRARRPDLARRVVVVPDDRPDPDGDHRERERYARGRPVPPSSPLALALRRHLDRIAGTGPDGDEGDAFEGLRLLELAAGEELIRSGTAAGYAYVPTGPGLEVASLGGYGSAAVSPWSWVGTTGVLRDGERNSTVRATEDVEVVAVPGQRFRRSWFRPLSPSQLVDLVTLAASA